MSGQSAKDVNARAADWLQRREFWTWSETDQAALDAWLDESWAHRVAYHRLETAWSRTGRLAALRGFREEKEESARSGARPFLFRIAAAAALIAVIGAAGALYIWQPQPRSFATAKGERETISLSDGTQIELNTNTRLRILATGAQRQVWLDRGEAYFEVRHDPNRPFTVWAGNKRVTDIGTKFVVRKERAKLELSVIDGRVGVSGASDPHPEDGLRLSKGDVLIATANSTSVQKASAKTLASDFSWLHGMLVFDDMPVAQVVAEFNRYSSEKLVVADEAAARTRVSATFPVSGVEDFVALAHRVLGLKVQRKNGETVISSP